MSLPCAIQRLLLLDRPEPRPQVTRKKDRPKCGAKTKTGRPCRAPVVWDRENNRPYNGRCRLHGRLHAGPRTPEARRRISEAAPRSNRRRAVERREREAAQ